MRLRASALDRGPGSVAAPAVAAAGAIDTRDPSGAGRPALSWVAPALLLAGLALVVAARWAGTRAGIDPLLLGAAFGTAFLGLAWTRPTRPAPRNVAIGAVGGLALVGLTGLGLVIAGVHLPPGLGRPAAPFIPWAAITVLVATAEEAFLRGRLFDATRHARGMAAAIALTSVAFALLHVPLYGWGVVPLDIAVGLGFAGLRLVTGGIAAPAAAHTVADLATWWL